MIATRSAFSAKLMPSDALLALVESALTDTLDALLLCMAGNKAFIISGTESSCFAGVDGCRDLNNSENGSLGFEVMGLSVSHSHS